jgi:hypothetical protein
MRWLLYSLWFFLVIRDTCNTVETDRKTLASHTYSKVEQLDPWVKPQLNPIAQGEFFHYHCLKLGPLAWHDGDWNYQFTYIPYILIQKNNKSQIFKWYNNNIFAYNLINEINIYLQLYSPLPLIRGSLYWLHVSSNMETRINLQSNFSYAVRKWQYHRDNKGVCLSFGCHWAFRAFPGVSSVAIYVLKKYAKTRAYCPVFSEYFWAVDLQDRLTRSRRIGRT